jgi:ADP-ribose pyrophosphatase YjhB (NUDIX family)
MTWPTHIVSVGAMVQDGKGNVLLVKSNHRKIWEFPGGQVELGENLEEAVIREIKEESGTDVTVRSLAALYSSVQQTIWYDGVTEVPPKLNLDFICDYIGGELTTSDETSEVIWCPCEKALEMITHPIFKMRMENLLNFSGEIYYSAYSSKPYQQHYNRYL